MYKQIGNGGVTLHGTRYAEELELDARANYKLGFDITLLPCIRFKNNTSTMAFYLRWLCWEFCAYWYKTYKIEYDVQGCKKIIHQGLRYQILKFFRLRA